MRVGELEVRAIIDTTATIDVTPFIEAASILVDQVNTCALARGVTLSGAQLKKIEAYLAAHLYAFRDPQYQSKSTERASATFYGQTGMALDFTPWGQMAKVLDTSGCLAAMASSARASAVWLGKPKSGQIDVEQRD